MNKSLVLLMALALLSGIASAGTVTLSGLCSKQLSSNSINFTLTNSGTDAALSLTVTPVINGATLANSSYQIPAVNPGSSQTLIVNLTNVTAYGSYADYIEVSYQQGAQAFTATFLCNLGFFTPAPSELYISPAVTSANGRDTINASILNGGGRTIVANISLITPPAFAMSNGSTVVSIAPYQTAHVHFAVPLPRASAQEYYQGAVAASYFEGKTHYASLQVITLSNLPSVNVTAAGGGGTTLPTPSVLLGGVTVAIVAVILFLILRATKRSRSNVQPPAQV